LARLVNDQGVKLRRFNDDIYDSFAEAAEEVFDEVQAHSDLASRIHKSFATSRAEVGAWAEISDQAYLQQRNRALGG
jgi:TRAP-type mannitol/chloroaromatic compound transport system substrate-binding protein